MLRTLRCINLFRSKLSTMSKMINRTGTEEENLREKIVQAAKDKFDKSPKDLPDFLTESVYRIATGNDVSIIQPPGAGKSMCFSLPVFTLSKRAVVVQPIVPTMYDQGEKLSEKGLKVEIIGKNRLDDSNAEKILRESLRDADMIFVAPDALFDDDGKETFVIKILKDLNAKESFALVALDEAHLCWHAFQPQYRKLLNLKNLFPNIPLMALTGTATKECRKKLQEEFLRKDRSKEFWASMDRPYISLMCKKIEVHDRGNKPNDPEKTDTDPEHWKDLVEHIAKEVKDEPAVVFFDNQEACETLEKAFKKYAGKVKTLIFSGDQSVEEQTEVLKSWIDGKATLMIATTAMGHGVDREDVRHVYRLGIPQSLEEWIQESGRSGRDKKPARATLLWHSFKPEDMDFKDLTPEEKANALQRLQAVLKFCDSKACRRGILYEYFGEDMKNKSCDNCDVCLGLSDKADVEMKAHSAEAPLDL